MDIQKSNRKVQFSPSDSQQVWLGAGKFQEFFHKLNRSGLGIDELMLVLTRDLADAEFYSRTWSIFTSEWAVLLCTYLWASYKDSTPPQFLIDFSPGVRT